MLRFNLICSYGLEEFGLLELANAAGELTVTEAQIQKLQSLRNKWVKQIDQDLNLPTEQPSDDREKRWDLLEERIRRVQAIRYAGESELQSELNEFLDSAQWSRLKQIRLQKRVNVYAIDIFNDPSINKDLALTRNQSDQLVEVRRKIASERNRFPATKMKINAYKTYYDSLSSAQKNVWRKKLGPPVCVSPVLVDTGFWLSS